MSDLPVTWCPHCQQFHKVRYLVSADRCQYTGENIIIKPIDHKTWRVDDNYSESMASSTLSGSNLRVSGSGLLASGLISSIDLSDQSPACPKCGKSIRLYGISHCYNCGFELNWQ